EVLLYFVFTTLCIGSCFLFGSQNSPWDKISDAQYDVIFNVNIICTVLLSASFAFLTIVSERKYAAALLEQKKRAEEAMSTRSQFLSHMGHELRTPLNGIIGATNLLLKQKTLPEQEEFINILKYCSNHMLELINNILDYNKMEAGKLEVHLSQMNMKQLLENAMIPFHNRFEEKKIELRLELDPALDTTVMVDDIRLVQILNNLVSNALKFTDRGYVKLKAQCRNQSDDRMEVLFSVQDTGIGIKEDDQRKIFESFEQVYSESTRKYHGTGLGLSISQRLLNLMDSRLEVKSGFGQGSTFFFSISFNKKGEAASPAAVVKTEQGDLSGMRVLIAEDNLINMLIATKMLEEWKVEFTTAENGKVALEALKRDSNYNMILMDLEMPEMDGYTAVREITKLYPDVPVIAFTAALVDNEMYTKLKYMGFVDAVLKPFQPMELFSKIRYYAN
ncbi:MAG TPA: ATP-binding protein, partial [Chitinophagaceae bacterium]|nr:ATP-binding protein [Chitinophagaceae bacterium]